jgi:uncharacterized lipoprotein YddW (UPF0748 family)
MATRGWFGVRLRMLVVALLLLAAACSSTANGPGAGAGSGAVASEPASAGGESRGGAATDAEILARSGPSDVTGHLSGRSAEPPPMTTVAPGGDDDAATATSRSMRLSVPDGGRADNVAMRGAWVHLFDPSLKTRAGIDRVVADAAAAGVNTLLVQVVRRHDAYYDSAYLPRTTDTTLEDGLDVLAHVIERASVAGIAVQAWIVVGPTYHGGYKSLPEPDGWWVWSHHGPHAPEGDRWVTRSHDGVWGEYLDPALPEVSDHVVAIATEIARNYRVDGVHLDYIRYPGAEWGYHPRALERFHGETGRSDLPTPSDPQWSTWRRAQVTALAGRVTRAVHDADPAAIVSAATIAWGQGPTSVEEFRRTQTYRSVLQDWPSWVVDGTVDAVYPMLYFQTPLRQEWLDRWLAFTGQLASGGRAEVAAGVGAWLNPPLAVIEQLRRGAEATDGAIVYSWQQPSDGDRDATLAAIRELWGAHP